MIKLFYNILENVYEVLFYVEDVFKCLIKIDSECMDVYIKVFFVNIMNVNFFSFNLKLIKVDKF